MTVIRVIAAVIERDDRWLVGQRPQEKKHGGLWEFPGGKVDPGESDLEAARRELSEELALEVENLGPCLLSVADPGSPFVIDFFETTASGIPIALEHSALGWFNVEELRGLSLAPADSAFADWLAARASGAVDSAQSP
ncbi:MAG: (deoxy)nucleoside triphosphate pyrophosphohydrolase [Gemmatimonadetes bacterium]|nr:(deoxy)nucleoside triphosphate pyrophosphohydrolase [Gemmatimonadota bacterium]MDA1102378.1 (deoxy)nucleoside triphosphate pyrophosphohydrolase [Gemmatimonadota bacterium]